jgi:hypothetical protein
MGTLNSFFKFIENLGTRTQEGSPALFLGVGQPSVDMVFMTLFFVTLAFSQNVRKAKGCATV